MKILITGSTGLTGSEAVSFFKEKGWDVVGIDNNMRSQFFGGGSPETEPDVKIDIRNEGAIDELFRTHKFDAIIHAAAQKVADVRRAGMRFIGVDVRPGNPTPRAKRVDLVLRILVAIG